MAKKGVKQTSGSTRQQRPTTTAPPPAGPNFRWISIGFGLLAFLLYVNTLGHQYVLDDPLAISEKAFVKKGISGIPDLLSHHYRAGTEAANASALLYRPLSPVTFAVEWSVSPDSPFLGHLMNVVWYALTVMLLFAALRRVFHHYHWLWAAGATMLFATHPMHTEVVANIKSRDEILNVFFSVAAVYCWARRLEKPTPRWMAAALGCYFLALMSKESAVTLLPVFPLIGWTFFNKDARQSAGHGLLFALPVVLFLIIRASVLSHSTDHFVVSEMDNPIVAAAGFSERLATSCMVLWRYLQMLFFPHPLLSDYSYRHLQVVGWSDWQALAGLAVYGALVFFAIRGVLRREALAFCIAAFLCGVVLYSQLFLVIGTLFGERLMYLPSVWFCAGLALVLWRLTGLQLHTDAATPELPAPARLQWGLALPGLITVFFALATFARNPDWKTNLTLFTVDSAKAPESVRLHNGMGSELYTRYLKEPDLSAVEKDTLLAQMERHSRAGLAVRPNPVSFLNLGNVAICRHQYAEAIREYGEALKVAPQYGIARTNIARTYQGWGREEGKVNNNLPKAAELFEKAIEYGMNDADVYLDLGTTYGMMGQNEKAIQHFEHAATLNPQNKTIWKNLSIAYRAVGNTAKAAECAQRAQ